MPRREPRPPIGPNDEVTLAYLCAFGGRVAAKLGRRLLRDEQIAEARRERSRVLRADTQEDATSAAPLTPCRVVASETAL